MKNFFTLSCVLFICLMNCNDKDSNQKEASPIQSKTYKILALGDSYSIGESVCETCRFPEQLKKQLMSSLAPSDTINLKIIAKTGWTTTNLITALNNDAPSIDNDLVTLLIGVNNQYQHKPFSLYEEEFPILINDAIRFAKGDKSNVLVISIPDYAYTPFGQGTSNPQTISDEIDQYNNFARIYCQQNGITFLNITDITRNGLINTDLVASDGLHPSELAYTQFVERLLPITL